mmetsp:Transcript_148610/g.378070  ORF Transcript_148610/g.378070 Transcript_148610/m.378070 type:complete len:137 (+) Transcript_148610:49-459(+)
MWMRNIAGCRSVLLRPPMPPAALIPDCYALLAAGRQRRPRLWPETGTVSVPMGATMLDVPSELIGMGALNTLSEHLSMRPVDVLSELVVAPFEPFDAPLALVATPFPKPLALFLSPLSNGRVPPRTPEHLSRSLSA